MFLLITALLSINILSAQTTPRTTDEDLKFYIRLTGLKALPPVAPKREALYQLGLRLFYDKQLSGNNNISCHACHSLSGYSADTLPLGVGEGADGLGPKRVQAHGNILPRHTPSLYNAGIEGIKTFMWDGSIQLHPGGGWLTGEAGLNGPNPELAHIAKNLDSLLSVQALFPIANPEEMLGRNQANLSRVEAWEQTMHRIFNGRLGGSYKRFFREAYPEVEEFNIAHAANAIAELVRHHFVANMTPWDEYLRGRTQFMSERMKKGAIVFMNKGQCTNCHTGAHLSSFGFQNIGIPQVGPGIKDGNDLGRAEFTGSSANKYQFRVTPLRNGALTAPYMHSGVFKTMWEVIDHYDHPMRSLHHFNWWNPKDPRYSQDIIADLSRANMNERARTLGATLPRMVGFTSEEKKDLYCFLMVGLTDFKLQHDLIAKGVLDETPDCSPVIIR